MDVVILVDYIYLPTVLLKVTRNLEFSIAWNMFKLLMINDIPESLDFKDKAFLHIVSVRSSYR